jgi:hypothetical protein
LTKSSRHCQAVWHAALHSGYQSHQDDRYRYGDDMAHWETNEADYARA